MPTLSTIKADPSCVKQLSGCCGFAAVLMDMLVQQNSLLDALVDCATKGSKFGSITKSTRVRDRLLKRKSKGIVPTTDAFDQELCITLMLLLKEHSKQVGSTAWDDCIPYSRLWSWKYSSLATVTRNELVTETVAVTSEVAPVHWYDWAAHYLFGPTTTTTYHTRVVVKTKTTEVKKLKDMPSSASVPLGLQYKKGDLALPSTSLLVLLDIVGIGVKKHEALIDDTGFAGLQGKKAATARSTFKAFHDEIRKVQTGATKSPGYSGVIVGVGDEFTKAGFQAYHNVTHWIYVPIKPKTPPGTDELRCWTWGAEHDFWAKMTDTEGYFPTYAVYLK